MSSKAYKLTLYDIDTKTNEFIIRNDTANVQIDTTKKIGIEDKLELTEASLNDVGNSINNLSTQINSIQSQLNNILEVLSILSLGNGDKGINVTNKLRVH